MIQEKNWKISLEELSLRGKQIIAQQPAITYVQALAQVQQLKKTSSISQKSKKSRVNS